MDYVLLFFSISFLSWLATRTRALLMIKEISSNSKYYPKLYTLPAKWIRKIYRLNKRIIPKYLYLELIMSLIYAILGPINLLITLILDSRHIAGYLIMFHICLVLVNTIFFVIMSSIVNKR